MTIQTTGSFHAFAKFISRESNQDNLTKAFEKMNKKGLFSLNVVDAPSKFYTMMGIPTLVSIARTMLVAILLSMKKSSLMSPSKELPKVSLGSRSLVASLMKMEFVK